MALLFANYLKRANIHKDQLDWDSALRAIRSALYILPTAKEALRVHVKILRGMEDSEQAASILEEALEYHPYWPWAILEMSELLVCQLQRSSEAWRWLQRLRLCQHLTPREQVRWCCLKVKALLDQHRWYEASQDLRQALALFPHDPKLLYFQGWVALQRHNYCGAASAFLKVLKQDPEDANTHYHLGKAFHGMGEYRLMREHFSIVYELDAENDAPLRQSHQEFLNVALEALDSLGHSIDCSNIRVVVEESPSSEILNIFPYDPRNFCLFVPELATSDSEKPQGTFFLFQQNLERTRLRGEALREKIVRVYRQQLATSNNIAPANVANFQPAPVPTQRTGNLQG